MTQDEWNAFRELHYIAGQICEVMVKHPDLTARQLAGDISEPDDEISRLVRALKATQKIIAPWMEDAEPGDREPCQILGSGVGHRDDGRGRCIDCGAFL